MILEIDVVKAFVMISHTFMIAALNSIGQDGTFLNIVKAHDELYAQRVKTRRFSTNIIHKSRLSTLTTSIQYIIGI